MVPISFFFLQTPILWTYGTMNEKIRGTGTLKWVYATETYFTHFLEEARFPKALVLARRKVNIYFTPREVS